MLVAAGSELSLTVHLCSAAVPVAVPAKYANGLLKAMTETTDPNHFYDLKVKTDVANVYYQFEVGAFARVFYKPGHQRFLKRPFVDGLFPDGDLVVATPHEEIGLVYSCLRLFPKRAFLSRVRQFQRCFQEYLWPHKAKRPLLLYHQRFSGGIRDILSQLNHLSACLHG